MAGILLRLNIGCGNAYKPGFINVDPAHDSIADERWDLFDIPLNDGSVDLIEADHILEFHDIINARYLLAECWRVLKPGGELVIETPNLIEIFKRAKKAQGDEFIALVTELFGSGTKGSHHGVVFKDRELESILISSGFEVEEMLSLKGKDGKSDLKVLCRRGRTEGRRKVEVLYRKRIRKIFKGDPYLLVLIEVMINDLFFSLTVDGEPREPIFTEYLFRAAVADPEIPGQLLLSMKAYQKGKEMVDELMEALKFIHEEEIKSRAFTLWLNKNKGTDVRKEFERFISDLSENIRANLMGEGNHRIELQSLLSQEPTHIRMLDFDIVNDKAHRWLNEGIRSFSKGDMDDAKAFLSRSVSAVPILPFAHWNLARVSYIEDDVSDALKRFDKVFKSVFDRDLLKEAKKEQEHMRRGTLDREGLGPRGLKI